MAKSERKLAIRIEGDTKHFEINLEKAKGTLTKFRKETSKVYGSQSGLSKGFQQLAANASVLHGPLNGISGRLNAISTSLRLVNPLMVAGGAAISGLSVGMYRGAAAAKETERQMAQLSATLETTRSAAGFTAQNLDQFSRDLARNTLASTEGVREAVGVLLTYKNVSGETFKETIRQAQNVAEIMQTDVVTATKQMAKAMESPSTALASLTRNGVSFNDQQKKAIDLAYEAGDVYAQQAIVLKALRDQADGVAEAVARQTQAGGWDTLTQDVTEFFETIARVVKTNSFVVKALTKVANAFAVMRKYIDPTTQSIEELDASITYLLDKAEGKRDGSRAQKQLISSAERLIAARAVVAQRLKADAAARVKGEIEQTKIDQQNKADAYERAHEKYVKDVERVHRATAKALAGAQGALKTQIGVDKLEQEYATALEQWDRYDQKMREKHQAQPVVLAQYEAASYQLRQALLEEFLRNKEQAYLDDEAKILANLEKVQQAHQDAADYKKNLEKEQLQADAQLWAAYSNAAGAAFGEIGNYMEEGSRAQRAFFAVQKGFAAASAVVNAYAAAVSAMKDAPGPAQSIAYAAALAQGMAAVTAISSVVLSARAAGGPVKPGTSYWVGEHGPERVTFPQNGHVTSNEDMTPNVNVNIVEDASKAGQVNQDGSTIEVFVAAAMNKLNEDFSSGRGIFASMENKYSLTRR